MPGWPWPLSRTLLPSATPAGTRTVSERVRVLTPSPPHSGHGSSMIRPVPRQSRHGSENANAPWLLDTNPEPAHVGQTCGAVPGRAPEPPQVSQRPGDDSRIGTSAPRTASTKSIVSSDSTSAPRRLRVDVVGPAPRPPPPPNRPPKRSPSPPAPPACPPAPALRSRSFRSNGCPPDAPVPKPPGKPPPPKPPPPPANRARVSSYSLRFFSSESTP